MRPLLGRKQLLALSVGRLEARALSSCCCGHDEWCRNVKVSVWWDFENCQVPAGVDALGVAPAITKAVRWKGIKGPLRINAFGDVLQLSKANQQALSHTGIHFTHTPGGKNSADRFLLLDLMDWVSHNPPPAHLFLISSDGDFAGILHRLRMNNYNILLASAGQAPDLLCSAATIVWQWPSLVKGEYLSGKHFNHPRDSLLCSRYGNYKAVPEKPFSAVDLSTSSPKGNIYEPYSDLHTVPEAVVRQIWHILTSHPQGISIGQLRVQLKKHNVHFGKSFYGYGTFSRILSSTPRVKLKHLGEGNFHVYLVPSEPTKPFEGNAVESVTSCIKIDERGSVAIPKLNGEDKNKATEANETPITASSHERSMDDDSKSFQLVTSQVKPMGEYVDAKSSMSLVEKHVPQIPNELQKSSLCSVTVVDTTAQLSKIQPLLKDHRFSKTMPDSFKMSFKSSFDDEIVSSGDAGHKIEEKYMTSESHSAGNDQTVVEDVGTAKYESENFTATDKYENPTRKEVDEVCQSRYSFPVDDSLVDKKPGGSDETCRKGSSFFAWIRSLWQLWNCNAKYDNLTAHPSKVVSHFEDSNSSELIDQTVDTVSAFEEPKLPELDQNVISSRKPALFSSSSFWNNTESFIFTLKGSFIVSQSKNREDIVRKLQKEGPPVFRSLTEKDILQLVELLISEKKWLEESPSQTFPFRLTQPVHKNSLMAQSHCANGLRSLFLSRASQSTSRKSFELDVEKYNQSFPYTGVSATATEMKSIKRSRNDTLENCQKLVSEILREHPEGYSISSFPRLFVDRYGYHLDVQKLGYQKLANLLQIMPQVKVQSAYIYPSVPAVSPSEVANDCHANAVSNSDSELSDSASKDDNMESLWEESGPVAVNYSNRSSLESELSQKARELDTSKYPDCEPMVLGCFSSESEGDRSYLDHPEQQGKPKCNEQDSSFWQAQELLNSRKERENNVKSDNIDVSGNSVADIFNSSTESTRDTLSKEKPNFQRGTLSKKKPRSQKKYSFVAETVLPNKDNIDGILDDESKMQH